VTPSDPPGSGTRSPVPGGVISLHGRKDITLRDQDNYELLMEERRRIEALLELAGARVHTAGYSFLGEVADLAYHQPGTGHDYQVSLSVDRNPGGLVGNAETATPGEWSWHEGQQAWWTQCGPYRVLLHLPADQLPAHAPGIIEVVERRARSCGVCGQPVTRAIPLGGNALGVRAHALVHSDGQYHNHPATDGAGERAPAGRVRPHALRWAWSGDCDTADGVNS